MAWRGGTSTLKKTLPSAAKCTPYQRGSRFATNETKAFTFSSARRLLVVAFAGIAAAAACGSSTADDPLRSFSADNMACIPVPIGESFTVGVDVTYNTSNSVVTIDRTRLTSPRGLRVFASKIQRPHDDEPTAGLLRGWPPVDSSAVDTAGLPDAVGATLQPDDKQAVVFVFGVKVTAGNASSGPVEVGYHDGSGQHFTWRGNVSYSVTQRKSCQLED